MGSHWIEFMHDYIVIRLSKVQFTFKTNTDFGQRKIETGARALHFRYPAKLAKDLRNLRGILRALMGGRIREGDYRLLKRTE
ncbi:hypothetical protein Tco_0528149 [Tanacetum coccineum]